MKDNLISVLAHDLRNPLGHFMQMTNFLVEDFSSFEREEILSHLIGINESSKNTYDLLENILNWQLTRKNSNHIILRSEDIKPQVDVIITQLNYLAIAKNIKIVNGMNEDSYAMVDKKLFHTIIRNLVVNSIKFSYSGGEIIISSQELTVNDINYLKVSITDKGIGMDENQIHEILGGNEIKINYGTEREKGTGLGLIICKEFIELLGGEFNIESTKGQGSTVYVMLKSEKNDN
ncbi:HAMP domain-containing histidine kinase [Lentimicrobium sp. L6]|uniref:sensor histidine kinase n=1 Tax=Lentimicrobium sp. L6 TaxID=2735916 RepID=UPI0015571185|nr:HAMP domain-containing sensor histidine kinase [Lentimicrobium sp. L6]NPD85245.1 HAMP domain-containing histidine kinase [Lentimicrobium sp. L6]